jgi:hypothetical protein
MDKEIIDFQVNNICEAYGCFRKATTKISVRVGQLGTIPLDLCTDCMSKFDQVPPKADLKQKIVRNEEDKRSYDGVIEK